MTSIPIRVLPRAGSQYGYANATKMLTKYMNVLKSVGRTVNENGERSWLRPSVGTSTMVTTNPRNKRFFDAGVNHGVFDTLDSALIAEDRATKDEVAKDLNKIYKYSTLLFQNSERITREMAFMMNAELAYDAHIKDGKSAEVAEELAIKDAVEATRDTMGNYREFERPSIMRSDLARAVFLFKMYAVNQTKFLWTNAIQMFKHEDKATRWRLKKELAGVLMMAGVFGGATALPLYSTICWLLDMLMGDDDDRDAEDPFLANDSDSRFRYEWLPSHFGETGGKILERGLVSYLTGANVSSRVSLDNLWFRNPQYSPTYAGKFYNMLEANLGPNVSVASNYAAAADDFSNGDTDRGLEKILPAGLKGFATATRLAREGAQTYSTDPLVTKDELSTLEIIGAGAGFQPLDVADAVTKRNAIEAARSKMKDERTKILGLYNKTRYNENATDADWDRVSAMMEKFNRRYPQPGSAIDEDTISRSEKNFDSAREKAVYGSPMTDEELMYAPWFTEGRNYK